MWLKEQYANDEEIIKRLNGDAKLVARHCSLDTLYNIFDKLPSVQLYIPQTAFDEHKKDYIVSFHKIISVKELAAKLKVSEQFIYDVLASRK